MSVKQGRLMLVVYMSELKAGRAGVTVLCAAVHA